MQWIKLEHEVKMNHVYQLKVYVHYSPSHTCTTHLKDGQPEQHVEWQRKDTTSRNAKMVSLRKVKRMVLNIRT